MIISDAIAEASTEHEVNFLLTAYLEAVRHGDQHCLLPDDLTRLPLAGNADVRHRLERLDTSLPGNEHGRTLLHEARHVMGRPTSACAIFT